MSPKPESWIVDKSVFVVGQRISNKEGLRSGMLASLPPSGVDLPSAFGKVSHKGPLCDTHSNRPSGDSNRITNRL
jgi:hypothetical protein